jgi:hypothetical protein
VTRGARLADDQVPPLVAGCHPVPVAPSDDLPLPPRRPLLLPVAIATVLLIVIGSSVGLVMGARAKDRGAATAASTSTTPADDPTASAPPCRPESQAAAQRFSPAGTLMTVLRIRTATSSVWICADAQGRLFYHANRGGEQDRWIEGKTALFLPDVAEHEGRYRVTATDREGRVTTFDVSPERLFITHKDGREEVQPAQ